MITNREYNFFVEDHCKKIVVLYNYLLLLHVIRRLIEYKMDLLLQCKDGAESQGQYGTRWKTTQPAVTIQY